MIRNLLTAALIFWGGATVLAQGDSTRYINGLPVSEDDTVQQFPQRDLGPRNEIAAVPLNKLPRKLVEALEKEDQYDGWRDTTVYFQRNTGLYLVPVKYEDGVRVFGVDGNGNPVTYDEVSRRKEQ